MGQDRGAHPTQQATQLKNERCSTMHSAKQIAIESAAWLQPLTIETVQMEATARKQTSTMTDASFYINQPAYQITASDKKETETRGPTGLQKPNTKHCWYMFPDLTYSQT